ncbi:hypothetical protein L7F22_006003 [Adiantum nelumboides]|nr:hypothetical protein [Adiantum nelumboides]
MKKELPTSFFDTQVQLLIHLVDAIELGGVVSARWMFWAERFMGVLKGYVRQKARPEGSMVKGWMLEECMYYVCEYLERTDFEAPRVWTNESSSTMSDELFDSVDPKEANQDELITSSNLDTSTLETCRISLADHDGIVDDENDNHPYSDTTDTKEEEIVDVEHMEEMNVNTNLTAEEFEEVNKDNEDEILLTVNLRDDDEDY